MTSSSSDNSRLQQLEEMLREEPNDAFLQYAAALEYEKIGNTTKAIQVITELLRGEPDYLGAYYQLGRMYESVNQNNRAMETYRAGIDVANRQKDVKAKMELSEALMLLLDED